MFPLFVVLALGTGFVLLHEYATKAAGASAQGAPGSPKVAGQWYRVHLTLDSRPWTSTTAAAAVHAAMVAQGFVEPIAVLVNADADTGAWTATASGAYGLGDVAIPATFGTFAMTQVDLVNPPPPGTLPVLTATSGRDCCDPCRRQAALDAARLLTRRS